MGRCEVLIVDDDDDDIGLLSDAFLECGVVTIHFVYTCSFAHLYLEELPLGSLPRLIVAEHHLPGICDMEFIEKLKGIEKYQDIPLLILSSIAFPKDQEKYRRIGALDCLDRPSTYTGYVAVAQEMKKMIAVLD